MQTMAPPAAMTSSYRPLAEDLLLLDAAKKDSTGTFKRPPIASSTGSRQDPSKIDPESVAHRSIGRTTAGERKIAEETNKGVAMRNLLYRKNS
jgi:hypothetical protein